MVGTANNPEALPSMLFRKGRLDSIWAVDLPTNKEREEIFRIHIKKRSRDPNSFDIDLLAAKSASFTGAEIESSIEDAMFNSFFDGKEVDTSYILEAIKDLVPQNIRDSKEAEKLREWANKGARKVGEV
jgi:SpoVK/Ycf46/Vps4 family AAA+-type ATPase